ncbi:MAG: hypothetical protein HWE25_02575 [Alphaproteobacteria bacterium]|nr:hypothetical protein [Alphaproteobacteria bacterium]
MIEEILTVLTVRAAPGAREGGLVKEIAGILGRHRRQRKFWAEHLQRTKESITAHMHHADPKEPILLMGAGLCLDVPLDALNSHQAGALLIDAVETRQTRRALKAYPDIEFERADLTGMLADFWLGDKNEVISPPDIAPLPLVGHGMAISCNILSQLPLAFSASPPVNETETKITDAIQKAHIRALLAMDCPALLITDYERVETSGNDPHIVQTVNPDLLPGDPVDVWDWPIAPSGEVAVGLEVRLKVGAWLLNV